LNKTYNIAEILFHWQNADVGPHMA